MTPLAPPGHASSQRFDHGEQWSRLSTLPPRVRAKFTVTDGCWPWHAATFSNGYGEIWDPEARKNRLAHRRVYELLVGPIPDGMQLDHLCRNKRCVNPDHLEPVTNRENGIRWISAMTTCKSGRHPRTGPGTCPECFRASQRAYRERQRAKAA